MGDHINDAEMIENLAQQLIEVEFLASMFPGPGEFTLDYAESITEIQRFLDGKITIKPKQVSFQITLPLENKSLNIKTLDVYATLPFAYPSISPPEIFVENERFSREQQRNLNDGLHSYMSSLFCKETCIIQLTFWLKENIDQYLKLESCTQIETKVSDSTQLKSPFTLSRMWIYSHHIYRKELLKKIPESAKELDLTGFVLSGKPGIICVEGLKENCDQYWQRLKYPNWKHISCKHREDKEGVDVEGLEKDLSEFRLFNKFEEPVFEAHGGYGLRNDYHMDLGQFRKYLEDHKCAHIFQIFFGLDGKS